MSPPRCTCFGPCKLHPPKFPLGQIVATPGALAAFDAASQTPLDFICRHNRGDWGTVGKDDWQTNDRALVQGTHLVGVPTTTRPRF